MKLNNEFYTQINGTSIGLIFVQIYVNLFIRYLQIKFKTMYTF